MTKRTYTIEKKNSKHSQVWGKTVLAIKLPFWGLIFSGKKLRPQDL